MNPEYLHQVKKFADEAIQFKDGENKTRVLMCLVYAESILDLGRTLADFEDRARLSEINKDLDDLRSKIATLIQSLNPDEVRQSFRSAGENIKTNYSHLLK